MRLVFLGSPSFATPVLRALLASPHEVSGLVTPPDRPRGRGRGVPASPLAELARERGVRTLRPKTTKDPAFVRELAGLEPEVLAVASYGEILRRDVLDLAPHGALNVHASLLPRWRGASPIQHAILAGDEETGVSVQRMVLALDEGDVLLAERTPIGSEESAGELLERLAELGGGALVRALDALQEGRARFLPQDSGGVTYAPKLKKEDGLVDWSRSAEELARFVRAMTPWPGARARCPDGRELVLLRARPVSGSPGVAAGRAPAGTAIVAAGGAFLVATGRGALELQEVKPAGRAAMTGAAFLRGARLAPGERLGS